MAQRNEPDLRRVGPASRRAHENVNSRAIAEALALCAGGCSLPNISPGGGQWRCQDLMHALGICTAPEVGKRLVRLRYMHEDQRQSLYECYLLDPVSKRAAREGWGPEMSHVMESALMRYLAPECCQGCNGEGARLVGPRVVVCDYCAGSGLPAPESDERINWLTQCCVDWEQSVLSEMSRLLVREYA